MIVHPDLTSVLTWKGYLAHQDKDPPPDWEEERREIFGLRDRAKRFLDRYTWFAGVKREYIGMFYSGIMAIFLFEIVRTRADVDEWVWVIVGDIPSAYITCEDCPNAATALDGYIGAMREWVQAAEHGHPVDDLIPVNVPATPEYAERLGGRLNFLETEILSQYEDLL